MSTAYSLKLNISADASQAIEEAKKAQAALDRLKQANSGNIGGTSANTGANTANNGNGNAAPLREELKLSISELKDALETHRMSVVSGDDALLKEVQKVNSVLASWQGAKPQNAQNASPTNATPATPSGASGGGLPQNQTAPASAVSVLGNNKTAGAGGVLSSGATAFRSLTTAAGLAFKAVRSVASYLGGAFSNLLRGLVPSLRGIALSIAGILGLKYSISKMLEPGGQMQSYSIQLETMVKDPRIARARLAELSKYAKDTNYSPSEVIGAGNLLQAYGMYSFRTLRAAGDAANAFGRSINEVIQSMAYLQGGRKGEALESLSRFGITRDKLKSYGIRFNDNTGELKSSTQKTLRVVRQIFEDEYGGMTARIGQTWNGAIQQLGGEVFDALSNGFSRAVAPATKFITKTVIPLIGDIGKALAAIDWNKYLSPVINAAEGFSGIVGTWLNPKTRGMAVDSFGKLWDGMKSTGMALLKYMGGIFSGALQSLGKTLGNFISGDGIKNTFALMGNMLTMVGSGFIASLQTLFSSLIDRLPRSMKSVLDIIPGIDTGETKASGAFMAEYVAAALHNAAYDSNWKISQQEYKQIKQATLEELHARNGSINDLRDLYWHPTGAGGYFTNAFQNDFGAGAKDTQVLDMILNGVGGRAMGVYLNHTTAPQRNYFEDANFGAKFNAVLSSGSKLFGDVANAIDISPLTSAIGNTGIIGDAWRANVAPVLQRGVHMRRLQNGQISRRQYLYAMYGQEAANEFAQPYYDWQAKYPNGQKWNTKQREADRQEAARMQNEIFARWTGMDKGKAQEEQQKRQDDARKKQEQQLNDLNLQLNNLKKLLQPIATAYA